MIEKIRFYRVWLNIVLLLVLPLRAPGQTQIEGQYRFIEDQPAGMSTVKSAEILLSVSPQGVMFITAARPGDVLTTQGTYTVRGNQIALDFPELDKSVADGPWRLDGDILILPMQFIGDGPGTSRWRRISSGSGPIQRFFAVLNREFENGTKAGQAVQSAADEAKRFSLAGPGREKALRIKRYRLWTDDAGCTLEFEDGHQEAVLAATASAQDIPARKQLIGLLARDPRTHIPAQPHTAPDDPKSKSAILFAPFDTTPFYALSWGVMGAPLQGMLARVGSHKEEGEDLEFIEKKLRGRNYQVDILRDAKATPLALHDAILKHPPAPGVIYFSTHGGAWLNESGDGSDNITSFDNIIFLTTGVCLGLVSEENEIHKNSERVKEIIRRTVPAGYYGPETEVGTVHAPVLTAWMQENRGLPVAYLGITNFFFSKIGEEGADFSSSFIYANGCYTVSNSALIESCGARMMLGNKSAARGRAMFAQARWIFTRLAKRTFSLREVLALMRHVAKTNAEIFPEDGWLARVEEWDDLNLQLYGSDGRKAQLPSFDVLYLCWLARWDAKNPEEGCQALEKTYIDFWSKESFSRLKSPFANAGVRGTHVPKKEEVEFARHLVSGIPAMPSGRFTLNDADPGKNKAEN